MQSYTEIQSTQSLTSSLPLLLNNTKTALSNNSGTAFPTVNLQEGMFCFRTDLNQLYQLLDLSPTWKLVFDLNKTATSKEYVDSLPSASFRNKIINGNFDIWQRGTSQSDAKLYGSDDRWSNGCNGSTRVHSQQAFTPGQTEVPNNPISFSRTAVTNVAGTGNYVYKGQFIEDVRLLSGKTVTLSFWAKADTTKNIAVEFTQGFGSEGSADVLGTGVTTIPLTGVWQKYAVTATYPSVSSKTICIGSYSGVQFWFNAGSNFNSRTNSLGQQSGTFDIAQVQLEEGSVETPYEQRPLGLELMLCQRYCEVFGGSNQSAIAMGSYANDKIKAFVPYRISKRIPAPLATYSSFAVFMSTDDNFYYNSNTVELIEATATGFTIRCAGSGSGSGGTSGALYLSDNAYIFIDAEL